MLCGSCSNCATTAAAITRGAASLSGSLLFIASNGTGEKLSSVIGAAATGAGACALLLPMSARVAAAAMQAAIERRLRFLTISLSPVPGTGTARRGGRDGRPEPSGLKQAMAYFSWLVIF